VSIISAKYRSIEEKDFTQDVGGAHDFFGIDLVDVKHPIVIVEGEIDALTGMECGIPNVISVPSGAPIKVADGKVSASEDKKFSFVWNAFEILNKAPYIIIATDNDSPGQALAEELSRRIGKHRCRLTSLTAKRLSFVQQNFSVAKQREVVVHVRALTSFEAEFSEACTCLT